MIKNIKKNKKIKNILLIPDNINIDIKKDNIISVCGKLGKINILFNKFLEINIYNKKIIINPINNYFRINIKSLIHTYISLIKNAIIGVDIGYTKNLILYGIGYKVELKDNFLIFNLGFSHSILYKIPNNINIICKNNIELSINGIDKQFVGQVSSDIFNLKKPDPYKGKGVRYLGQKIFLKESKKVK
ncbi:50S ribosomal protein L6 [endosymbiont of Euscepes postfasciatus]|uniref:50S ribosomal protein L6 n=1 Tax=endosymbiont of Euscepes postfasciatus TaxID=650377 RepID=UPI000DC6F4D2|nr:50S ribosomal protein L6 [endosymbiont of Euscepes postfasciatus]BBA84678.1 50S ribosomal protein L6 [endosymbiont of Euscepes postfasciatus]